MSRLLLQSPYGADPIVYDWPLAQNQISEMFATINWVCRDHPEVKMSLGDLSEDLVDTGYDNIRRIVDTYNGAVETLKKSPENLPSRLGKRPSRAMLKHILAQVYAEAVSNPNDLNNYEPFTPEVRNDRD